MHETGCSWLVHWNDPGGWDGEGGRRGFWMGNTSVPVGDSCRCLAKTSLLTYIPQVYMGDTQGTMSSNSKLQLRTLAHIASLTKNSKFMGK